jgi:cytidylate kinase
MAAGAPFDADCFVAIGQEVMARIASGGNCVIVGRGAPYFLRESCDVFHVFLYAPRAEKIRRLRLIGHSDSEAEVLVDTVDRDRIEFVKHYFGADWPTRSLYHMMINTAVGDECVISTILDSMQKLEKQPVTV